MASITLKKCLGCRETLEESVFIDEKGAKRKLCSACLEKRQKKVCGKQLCEECGEKGFFNFSGELKGIRCATHKLPRMVNLRLPEEIGKRIRKYIEGLGGQVIEGYKDSFTPIKCLCSNGHVCMPLSANVQKGHGICRICAGIDPETSKQNFIRQIEEELGGKVVGMYKDAKTPVKCLCINGHSCMVNPNSVQQRGGMCRVCAGKDPETSKRNFIRRIEEELEGRVVGEYKDAHTPVECVCKEGHKTMVRPGHIQQGRGMCRTCVKLDPKTSEHNFIELLENIGVQITGKYINAATRVECICAKGHLIKVRPNSVQQGHGVCKICSGLDPETCGQNFIKRVEELGSKVIGEYVNATTRIECICSEGHRTFVLPNSVQQGGGICSQCSQTSGENMVARACQELKIDTVYQARHPAIPTLRYDFSCVIKGKTCYIEFDGQQHFGNSSNFFGRSDEDFLKARQRDLLKTHICKLTGTKLVRLDYTWSSKSLENFTKDLYDALCSEQLLVADSPLYIDWINDKPEQATMAKYIVSDPPESSKDISGMAETEQLKTEISALERLQISA